MTILPPVLTPKNRWLPLVIIALLTLVSLTISVIALVSGWLTIFQNLFYFPIILACMYYTKWGFAFSVILACSYSLLMLIFSQDPLVLEGAATRVLIFILVAWVTTYSSIVRTRAENALKQAYDELEQHVAERTEELEQANENLTVNITERGRAQEESVLKGTLLDAAADSIIVSDLAGRIVFANKAAEALRGYAGGELIGQDLHKLTTPEYAQLLNGRVAKIEQEGELTYESARFRHDGTSFPIEVHACLVEVNGQKLILQTARDITERKRAEEALRESEELYQSLVQVSPMSICRKDLAGRFTFANQRFLEELNPSLADLIGKTDFDLHPPELAEKYQRDDRAVMDSGQAREFIEERAVLGGESTIIQSYKTPIYDDAGKVNGVQVSFWDITERTKLEQEVAHLASFPALSPFGIIEIGCDGSVRFANAAAIATLARLRLDPNARQFLPGTPEELMLLRSQCEWNPQTQELHLGEASFLRVVAAPPGGDSLRVYVSDITERKRAEEKLLIKDLVFENSIAAMSTAGNQGDIDNVNPAFVRLWGYKNMEEAIGKSVAGFFADPADAGPVMESLNSTGRWEGEFLAKRVNGETFVALGLATVLRDRSGKQIGYQSSNLDVTSERRAKEEILTLNAELEERIRLRTAELSAANKELEAFSYSVSHDLRAPLRSIDGFSQAAIEDSAGVLPEAARDDLGRVRLATQHMGQLIDDMLLLARVTRMEMHIQPVDMTALASDAADEIVRDNPGRAVQLDIEPSMTATGDSRLLRIVYANLLSNAWKFTSRHGHAHVAVGTTEDPEHGHAFFVRDDGAGFDPRYKDKLFAAFQRLHSLEEFPGTGIGLATVARAVRRHGGDAWADGEIGCGATFYFTIPDSSALQSAKEEQS